MDRIVNIYKYYCAVFMCLFLFGCKQIEHVIIKNNTDDNVLIEATLLLEGELSTIQTKIKPQSSDGWSYEINPSDEHLFDKRLVELTLENPDGCIVKFERNKVIKLVDKSGAWVLEINDDLIQCD